AATLCLAGPAFARLPNILLLIADDQRPDTIRALGNSHIQTPHLDELVRRGTVFTRATCAHPLCYPSRAELLTGCTGFRSGTYSELKLNEGVPLLPRLLKAAGYRTWYVGKWHTAGRPSTVGYDECDGLYAGGRVGEEPYVDFRGRPATGYRGWQFQTDAGQRFPEKGTGLTPNISAEFADAAIRLISQKSEQPFFVHVNFTAPHDPRIWPPGYEKTYDAAKLPLPANFRGEHPFDHGNARGRDEVLLPFPRTEGDLRQELACYYAVISHLDAQLGRILKALDETGQRASTLIVFTADHGLAIGSHGLVGKQNMYEHTINVPFVIAGPGIPAGEKRAAQCYLRDLFPTFCDLAGLATPPMDGRSLAPVLRGEKAEVHPFIVGYFQDSQRMIREGDWKLAWYPKIDRWQLFNVGSDPHELRDLIADLAQRDRVADLRAKLLAWLREQGDTSARESKEK
ncbi:MAG TPA: sulfatase-like hydrolase/transferase, partial [Pirellulaceae bacterium]|nr:sulfatase-like hydrolase/transferase [Pirellulaceae bacterium]